MTLTQFLCELLKQESSQLIQHATQLSVFGANSVPPEHTLDCFELLRQQKVKQLVIYDLLLSATGKTDKDRFHINLKEHLAAQQQIINNAKQAVERKILDPSILDELMSHTLFATG